ncbi:Gamma-aminobutyric acid (GABA) B receptor [Seminavis robusta]|uniref:Gamma-aminobutyric acid (GABA) B receptor n=1 Tax=Seminavis robusta TaxID=568900 RepID=A0A9N8HM56_9STRA|nr:Gamma-aminobutyric acid (GABA) B receptor [Seminavis robusta]|eukprot:Sro869_g213530.1 Gamma-aminobutyric acid (GABA) B receptor (830) ;mRNA; r:37719-40427
MRPRFASALSLTVLVIASLWPAVSGLLDGDEDANRLSLLIAVPLTKNNTNVPDPGWIQLASALLAIDHFNSRNSIVVPELADLKNSGCDITFGNISVLDTGTNDKHIAMEDLASLPDAIAGPYNEIPALELSVFATSLKIPVVAHRAFDSTLLESEKHPYFSQVSADPFSEMHFLASYLNHTGRNNYIAVVYSSTPSVMQKVDILRAILDQGMVDRQVRTFSYHSMDSDTAVDGLHDVSIRYALAKVRETGFRTVVLLADDIQQDAPEIQQAATDFELDQGDHFWVFSGGVAQLSTEEQYNLLKWSRDKFGNRNIFKGAAFLLPYDGFDFDYLNGFQSSLLEQNRTFVERLEALTPIRNYYDWSYAKGNESDALNTIMQTLLTWWQGSSYLYDATMAIGIGACEALLDAGNDTGVMTGDMLMSGIRSVDFKGASGRVKFKGGNSGTRVSNTIPYTVINLLPDRDDDELLWVTEIRDPATEEFITLSPFVYANGSNEPPALLRDVPEQNYIDCVYRAIGLTLMAIALLLVLVCTIWIVIHRNHNVVIAAQPFFLYAICLGSAIISLNIFFISPDEGMGWTEEMLDNSCIAAVWMNAVGMLLIYGSLFAKHWRVNRLMLHKSKNVSIGMWLAPVIFLFAVVVVLQSIWTARGAYGWERIEIDEVTGESIGSCTGDVAPCLYFTGMFLFIPVALAGIMAYKTLGVDDLYSESKWVLIFILVQFQVYLVGAPVLQILRTVSPDGRFIGETLIVWTVPMSTMGLIIFPKVLTVRRMQRNADTGSSDTVESQSSLSVDSPDPGASSDERAAIGGAFNPAADPTIRGPRIQVVTFD